jgi:hypothetical protein
VNVLRKKIDMNKKKDKSAKDKPSLALPPEDTARVNRLATDIMEPALQAVLRKADGQAPAIEIMSALANAYGGLLVDLIGRKAAVSMMRGHADHLESVEDQPINIEKH